MSWQNFILSAVIRRQQKAAMKLSPEHRFKRQRKFMAMEIGKANKSIICQPDEIKDVKVEWLIPKGIKNTASAPVCVYYHGGAFIMGGMNSHRQMCSELAAYANIKVLMVDYRLAPEHPFPAATDDAMTVYLALIDAGHSAKSIVIAGDSAGGNLALTTLQKLRDDGKKSPAAAVLFSPWLDLSHSSESFKNNARKDVLLNKALLDEAVEMYAPALSRNDPRVSPLFGNVAALPPILTIASRSEVLLDDASRLHNEIEKSGGRSRYLEWQKPPHAFPVMSRFLPEARSALRQSAAFITEHLP
ncbi:alpha/beta hydrolase [Zhongshania aquimaris]|uniref:Alpha/beta hydrolase n=1 Tax=Zhongshania aquimaris TaxID=2857107 RepID=A0ABS6VQ54_9GAMM|nr:alpha/beta hydrolase [Zhongshania aquimaris]MBW2939895.1 alpha/beta hydrolase [Zhongshania aquimaris]